LGSATTQGRILHHTPHYVTAALVLIVVASKTRGFPAGGMLRVAGTSPVGNQAVGRRAFWLEGQAAPLRCHGHAGIPEVTGLLISLCIAIVPHA
jgi:hypothetical protein